jgi:hypothetical protein
MKIPYYFITLIFLLIAVNVKAQQLPTSNKNPNIIFILVDDLGYGDVGFNGQKKIKTPHIDQLASEGMIFTNSYTGSTVCGPSRVSLMTGKHTGHSAVRENPTWTATGKPIDMSLSDVTGAEELKRVGFQTAVIGKWGLAEKLSIVVTADGSKTVYHPSIKENYHSRNGALQESNHVFLNSGLRYHLADKLLENVAVLEVGFGTGLNFLLTNDFCTGKEIDLNYVRIEAFPLSFDLIEQIDYEQLVSTNT